MASFLDVCRFVPTAGGTTDWTYSTAVVGYQSPTAAGAVNSTVYRYRAESADLSQWEIGYGAYNSGTGVFARTTILFNSLGTAAKVNFSTVPQVAIVALAEDLPNLNTPNIFTDTTEATGAGTTAAAIIKGGLEVLKKLFVSGIAAFTNATASTSTTTGAVTIAGGAGIVGALFVGGAISAVADLSASASFKGGSVTIVNGANAVISGGSTRGLILISDNSSSGETALALLGDGSVTIISQTGSIYVNSTTPAAGKVGIAFGSAAHRIYNNSGATIGFGGFSFASG